MTITEFLEARITEDEVSATLRECHREYCATIPGEDGYSFPCDCGLPERMTAECAAKRALCELHALSGYRGQSVCGSCGDWWDGSPTDYPCDTIKIIAAVYADHHDYRQEWTP